MNRREMKLLLEERFERIALLETRIDTMEQLVDGYRAREQAIIDTLHSAQNTALRVLEDARAEADTIREQARKEKQKLLDEAKRVFDAATAEAEHEANELRLSAKAETGRVLRDAEIIKREYDELIASFNAMLEQNASELQLTASRFAEFVKGRKIDPPEVRLDGEAFYKSVGAMTEANLPDPSGDPSTLMKNIYRLQNRPLPGMTDVPAGDVPAAQISAKPAAEQNEKSKAEPYSEAAWASAKQESKSEPQAEFTPAFSSAFTPSDFTLRPLDCDLPAEQEKPGAGVPGERALSDREAQGSPAPYSEQAWAQHEAASGHEPQAEAERAFDDFFSNAMIPGGQQAQDEVLPAQAHGPEGASPAPYSEQAWAHSAFTSDSEPQAEVDAAFDAMFGSAEPDSSAKPAESAKPAFMSEPVSYEGVALNETPAPAPYSEQAWAQSTFTSNHEPQAEVNAAFDAMFGSAEPDSSAKPAESAKNSFMDNKPEQAPSFNGAAYSFGSAKPDETPAPAPYSEQAWAQSTFTSDTEPQAEVNAAFDAVFSEYSQEEKAERSYQTEDEPHEWEPEREPEMGEIPTVSRFVPQSGAEDDISLDALLDEIIKAGE